MEKVDMRDWVLLIEGMVDKKLQKWDKHRKWENGEVVHLLWQWEQTFVKLDIFWEDKKETVRLKYMSPRAEHDFMWHGLDDATLNKIMDRVGNLAQATMYPIKDIELDA